MLKQLQQLIQHIRPGEQLFVDTNGGAFTITLPASPAAGDVIRFFDQEKHLIVFHLQLVETENLSQGDSADMTVNPEGAAFDPFIAVIRTVGVSQLYNIIFGERTLWLVTQVIKKLHRGYFPRTITSFQTSSWSRCL